jgi:D-cysteine desulfhydrase
MDLSRFPRRRYIDAPTPLQLLPRLSEHLGGPAIHIKRDDLTALAAGGNKTRKLEFLVADALATGCDTLLTTGAMQSNHCRLTLAAAAREGLRCQLALQPVTPEPYRTGGNRLLYDILGAERIRSLEPGSSADSALAEMADDLSRQGRRGYGIPLGGSSALGALGYAACAQELLAQIRDRRLSVDRIVCASSSGGTQAGLIAGIAAMGAHVPVAGINVMLPASNRNPAIACLAREALALLGAEPALPDALVTTRDEWLGPAYGVPTPEMIEAVELVARLEGILLDPVYSGKAMAGLIGLIRRGELRQGSDVIFLHTGGTPALFAYGSLFGQTQ